MAYSDLKKTKKGPLDLRIHFKQSVDAELEGVTPHSPHRDAGGSNVEFQLRLWLREQESQTGSILKVYRKSSQSEEVYWYLNLKW